MKTETQEKMGPEKAYHDISASSESESEDNNSESSTSSDESDSSTSGDDDGGNSNTQDVASKNGGSNEVDNDDSDSSSNDDSDSSSSDSDSSSSDSESGDSDSASGESSGDESEAKTPSNDPKLTDSTSSSSIKTEPHQRQNKQEKEEFDESMIGSSEVPEANQSQLSKLIIEGIVKNPAEFTVVDAPGPYTVEDISSENDYFIFRFPVGMLNPVQLAETKVSIRKGKCSGIQVNNRPFELMAYDYEPDAETPTLFLPDRSGELKQVDLQIKSQVVIRQPTPQLNTADIVQYNIDDLRSRVHQPPEIKERNFFASIGSRNVIIKKEKLSKKEKKLLNEKKKLSSEEGTYSKKAKKHKGEKELSEEAKRIKKMEKKLAKELAKKRSCDSKDILSPSSSSKKIKKEK